MFSFKPSDVNSAIRFSHLVIEESKYIIQLLDENFQEAERHILVLIRSIIEHQNALKELTGYAMPPLKQGLISDLYMISKECEKLFKLYEKERSLINYVEEVRSLLTNVSMLEKKLEKLLKGFRKEIPRTGEVFFAGVDGGGTKTLAAIGRGIQVLSEGKSGPSFPQKEGFQGTVHNMMQALEKACIELRLDFKVTIFKRVAFCSAGIHDKEVYERLFNAIRLYIERVAPNIEEFILIPDFVAAWFSAFRGSDGIIVIGGTGHIVYGRNRGRESFLLTLEKNINFRDFSALSGNIVTLRATKVLLRQMRMKKWDDLNFHSILRDLIKEAFEKRELYAPYYKEGLRKLLVDIMLNSERGYNPKILTVKDLGSLAPYVFKAAQMGDRDAIEIIQNAANNMAIMIAKVAKDIGLHNLRFPVGVIGSFIQTVIERRELKKYLSFFEREAQIIMPQLRLEEGLLMMAIENIRFY